MVVHVTLLGVIKALLGVAAVSASYYWLGPIAAIIVLLPIMAFMARRVVLGRRSSPDGTLDGPAT